MDIDPIIEKMIEKSGETRDSIDHKILEKQRELSGLVSREGAAYIVAKELGVEFLKRKARRLEIKNIVPNIKNLNLIAKVSRTFNPTKFTYKGKEGKVANVILSDESGDIRMSLWNEQVELLENLKPGFLIEIDGAYTKTDNQGKVEIRLSKRATVKTVEEGEAPPAKESNRKKISDLKAGEQAEIKASVVQLFNTSVFYEMCPDCGSRISGKCEKHGEVTPEYLIVLSGIIDDGTGNVRVVLFRDNALKLIGMSKEQAIAVKTNFFENIDILGKEFILTGQLRTNKMFKRDEFVVTSVGPLNIEKEVNEIINTLK